MLGDILKALGVAFGGAIPLALTMWGAYRIIRTVGEILLGYGALGVGTIWSKVAPKSYMKHARKYWTSGPRM